VPFDLSPARWLTALVLACGLSACVTTAPKTSDSGAGVPMATPVPAAKGTVVAARPAMPSAYQLQDCKPVQGWAIVGGSCDSFGLFQGTGTGTRGAMRFTGQFVAGLPQGKGRLCLGGASQDTGRNAKTDCGSHLSCQVEFNAGRLSGKEMVCQMAGSPSIDGRRAGLQFKLRSPSGFFIDDGAAAQQRQSFLHGKVSTITTDQAEVEISGQIVFEPLNIGDSLASGSAVGELRQVSLSAAAISFDRFRGQLAIPTRKALGGGGELRVKGSFSGQVRGERVQFLPYPAVITKEGAITRESIVELAVSDKRYQLVYRGEHGRWAAADPGAVLYYKDDAGVEFDGTFAGCTGQNSGFGFARVREKFEPGAGAFLGYELQPYCGKITTPSGSYAGKFENGRPAK
jgi:hypothetical protein